MDKLKSRKLWATVFGAVLSVLNGSFGWMDDSQMQWVMGLVMTYIGGQSVVDFAEKKG